MINSECLWHEELPTLNYNKFIILSARTHLAMESIAVVMHRNLAPNHPIFRLLAPHFYCNMAIDKLVPLEIKPNIILMTDV